MRKLLILTIGMILLAASPAFSDWRFDVGIDYIAGLGALADSDIEAESIADFGLILPVGAVSYEWEVGPVGIGAGVSGSTIILITVFWPDVFAEIELGPIAIEGHIGGLVFGGMVIGDSFLEAGNVLIPQLSAWAKLGPRFRLGGGAMGIYLPDLQVDGVAFLYYLGAKWVIRPGS